MSFLLSILVTDEQIAPVLSIALDLVLRCDSFEVVEWHNPTERTFTYHSPLVRNGFSEEEMVLNKDGYLLLRDLVSDHKYELLGLDRNALQRGLELLLQKYPLNFSAILAGSASKLTADALLQCALLGDVLYD